MIRARFKTKEEDYRPAVWPVPHPYWCTGQGHDYRTIVAYADDKAQILQQWPEAYDIDEEAADAYKFSDRFPKPDWLQTNHEGGSAGEELAWTDQGVLFLLDTGQALARVVGTGAFYNVELLVDVHPLYSLEDSAPRCKPGAYIQEKLAQNAAETYMRWAMENSIVNLTRKE